MEQILIRILFLSAIFWAATAHAGKQADKPRFKIGDRVRANKGLEWIAGYCPDPITKPDGKLEWPNCFTSRGPQPFAGKPGIIKTLEHRTCARDVGVEIAESQSGAEINRIRESWGGETFDEKKYDSERRKQAAGLMAIDSCDEYQYTISFGGKIGDVMLGEGAFRKRK